MRWLDACPAECGRCRLDGRAQADCALRIIRDYFRLLRAPAPGGGSVTAPPVLRDILEVASDGRRLRRAPIQHDPDEYVAKVLAALDEHRVRLGQPLPGMLALDGHQSFVRQATRARGPCPSAACARPLASAWPDVVHVEGVMQLTLLEDGCDSLLRSASNFMRGGAALLPCSSCGTHRVVRMRVMAQPPAAASPTSRLARVAVRREMSAA